MVTLPPTTMSVLTGLQVRPFSPTLLLQLESIQIFISFYYNITMICNIISLGASPSLAITNDDGTVESFDITGHSTEDLHNLLTSKGYVYAY
jgi:hypothetical protein